MCLQNTSWSDPWLTTPHLQDSDLSICSQCWASPLSSTSIWRSPSRPAFQCYWSFNFSCSSQNSGAKVSTTLFVIHHYPPSYLQEPKLSRWRMALLLPCLRCKIVSVAASQVGIQEASPASVPAPFVLSKCLHHTRPGRANLQEWIPPMHRPQRTTRHFLLSIRPPGEFLVPSSEWATAAAGLGNIHWHTRRETEPGRLLWHPGWMTAECF